MVAQGFSYASLLTLERTLFTREEAVAAKETATSNEAPEDPHRLARVNLQEYATHADGATIKFWRSEWYTWKPSRGCYRLIEDGELRAKIGLTIKREFDRVNEEEVEAWSEKSEEGVPKPVTRKVTGHLISNVLMATSTLVCVKSSTELNAWIDGDGDESGHQNYVAMENGILDLDRLLENRPQDSIGDVLLPHSPRWFSTVRLPYAFDPQAKCPKWDAFLERNLELDPERIKLLQEWAGYLLLPDTGQQKFLVMEGEGANGKSVYCAAIAAMLGTENCEHIPLELFGDRFAKTQTIGKLVNICADVGEIDKVAEGFLKSFVSGDTVFFDRKGIKGVNCAPTARLMIACNNRPKFSDRSSGIWRRMLLIPWLVQISEQERIPNMDKSWWWEKKGELPGIFLWAVRGLNRLRQQGRFTDSSLSKSSLEEYKQESNPTRAFLLEHFEKNTAAGVQCSVAYHFYSRWSINNGHRPDGERVFGREVKRLFPHTERKRGGAGNSRYWYYHGLAFTVDEICGEKIEEERLF
jgi:putative DNA primase/helicase